MCVSCRKEERVSVYRYRSGALSYEQFLPQNRGLRRFWKPLSTYGLGSVSNISMDDPDLYCVFFSDARRRK
jgi:hypothetical protein